MTDPIRQIVNQHLTRNQAIVFELHHHTGWSIRHISVHLGISRSATIDRYDNACRKLHHHGVRFTPDGDPYLEETA